MADAPSVIYSFIQGSAIISKIAHGDFIRMGIIVPVEKSSYPAHELHPNSYVQTVVLEQFTSIEDLLKEEKSFANKNLVVRSGNLIYGSALSVKHSSRLVREERHLEYMRIPLSEAHDITVAELQKATAALSEKNKFVGFELGNGAVISAAIAYVFGTELPGVDITLLEDVVVGEKFTENSLLVISPAPRREEKKAYGMRVEFVVPKDKYKIEKFEPYFDKVAERFGVSRLAKIEGMHEDFLKLKASSRQRQNRKVVKEVEV